MTFASRLIPLIGACSGVALFVGLFGCLEAENWRNVSWLFTGAILFYAGDSMNRFRHRELLIWKERARFLEARICAIDAHLGHKEVERIYTNSIEETTERDV